MTRQTGEACWSSELAGGFIEPDEHPADAARREAWEQTGLLVGARRLVAVYGGPECVVAYPNGDETQYIIIGFECVIESGELRADGDETIALRFWSAEEAPSLNLSAWLRSALPLVYASAEVAGFRSATWEPPMHG